jgi:hypothetical protein
VGALRIVAVDWSGRADVRQAETIWRADVEGGRLVTLENGRTRAQVVAGLIDDARGCARLVAGLDFSFSLPAWWLRERGLADVRDVWRFARDHGDAVLRTQPAPFFGAPGSRAPAPELRYRRTEEALRARGLPAKSAFGLAGAGAVGTGTLRGMPHLLDLADAGFAVWPFDAPAPHAVVEIYPRALTGPVDKGRWRARREHLAKAFPGQDPVLLERAAGSEDAFDAAVSALVMGRHEPALAALAPSADATTRLEGAVWTPPTSPAR